jgi:hypothetical protein
MQFFKEVITALLALVIIGVTAALAVRSFDMAGNTGKMGDAKDLLTLMLGVAGVVVGYYFGRVPGDARAAQAASRAEAAVGQREQMKAKARIIADNMDDAMTGSTQGAAGNGQPPVDHSKMRAIQSELRGMAASSDS